MKITKKELEMYLKNYEWVEANATINNNMTQVQVTFGQKKTQKQDKMDLILAAITEVKQDIIELKKDMVEVKKDIIELKKDMVEVKTRLTNLESDVSQLKSEAKNHSWNI